MFKALISATKNIPQFLSDRKIYIYCSILQVGFPILITLVVKSHSKAGKISYLSSIVH